MGLFNIKKNKDAELSKQVAALNVDETERYDDLKQQWEEKYFGEPFNTEKFIEAAKCPQSSENKKTIKKQMRQQHYITLSVDDLKKQLKTETLFPLRDVQTKEGNEVFYMRPAVYYPNKTPVQDVIDNLVYVMASMREQNHKNAKNGIAFLANMDGWSMDNFSIEYCYAFMQALQGKIVPAKVSHFFIVNPPSWFGNIWAIMRGMLAPSFRKKVKMIKEDKLSKYLKIGYQNFLPKEMSSGWAITKELVQDFIDERKHIEAAKEKSRKAQHRIQRCSEVSETACADVSETCHL